MHRNPVEIYGASCRDEDRKDFGGRGEGWYGRPRHRDSYKSGMNDRKLIVQFLKIDRSIFKN
jgi:hypothetical protein